MGIKLKFLTITLLFLALLIPAYADDFILDGWLGYGGNRPEVTGFYSVDVARGSFSDRNVTSYTLISSIGMPFTPIIQDLDDDEKAEVWTADAPSSYYTYDLTDSTPLLKKFYAGVDTPVVAPFGMDWNDDGDYEIYFITSPSGANRRIQKHKWDGITYNVSYNSLAGFLPTTGINCFYGDDPLPENVLPLMCWYANDQGDIRNFDPENLTDSLIYNGASGIFDNSPHSNYSRPPAEDLEGDDDMDIVFIPELLKLVFNVPAPTSQTVKP